MSEKIGELTQGIKNWAEARNIYHETDGATMASQLYKLVEETGETFGAIVKSKPDEIKDGIGDIKVCLVNVKEIYDRFGLQDKKTLSPKDLTMLEILSHIGGIADEILGINRINGVAMDWLNQGLNSLALQSGFTYEECIERAYNDIKDRKGTMKNRCFVKESDL